MAITKVGAMTDPPVAGDYAILQAKLDAYAKQVGNQGMILTQWTNTTTAPKIAMGSYITHGGTWFVVDTEDFAVPAPAGNGTYYLKVSVSGDTLAISWVASTAGYAWNSIYNGLYHADESQILPYQLVKAGATLTKRKITNLMQGSGFVTVDYLGAITGSGPIVATSIDTGQGANELYGMNQGVKTTDSPTFANIDSKVNDAEFYIGAKKAINISGTSQTEADWHTALLPYVPVLNDMINCSGWITDGTNAWTIHALSHFGTTSIKLYGIVVAPAFVPTSSTSGVLLYNNSSDTWTGWLTL